MYMEISLYIETPSHCGLPASGNRSAFLPPLLQQMFDLKNVTPSRWFEHKDLGLYLLVRALARRSTTVEHSANRQVQDCAATNRYERRSFGLDFYNVLLI